MKIIANLNSETWVEFTVTSSDVLLIQADSYDMFGLDQSAGPCFLRSYPLLDSGSLRHGPTAQVERIDRT